VARFVAGLSFDRMFAKVALLRAGD
jgi:hypothetical protein